MFYDREMTKRNWLILAANECDGPRKQIIYRNVAKATLGDDRLKLGSNLRLADRFRWQSL